MDGCNFSISKFVVTCKKLSLLDFESDKNVMFLQILHVSLRLIQYTVLKTGLILSLEQQNIYHLSVDDAVKINL